MGLRYSSFRNRPLYIVSSRTFRCSLDYAKRSIYRAANGIFGKIGRIASEDVVIQLLKSKCILILLYALEVCYLSKRDLQALDFSVNRFFVICLWLSIAN